MAGTIRNDAAGGSTTLPAFLAEDGDEDAPAEDEPSDDEADPLPAVTAK